MQASVPPPAQPHPRHGRTLLHDILRVGWKAGMMAVAVMGTVLGITVLVPDINDYALATLLKHERLARYDTRKIVLIGGSNLAFGVDSTMIQRATDCPVVNMGMNGYLGVRYMLEEVKPQLKAQDVVILAFEWDNFYKSVDGTAQDHLAIAKTNPKAFAYLTPMQTLRIAAAVPAVAQSKVMRLLSDGIVQFRNRISGTARGSRSKSYQTIVDIESLAGFTPEGDLVSHLGVEWPYKREDGIIPKGNPIESEMIIMLRDFVTEMAKRDVVVMVSYTPVIRDFYDRHHATLNEVHARITAHPVLKTPSPPAAFVYDEAYFFDTVYHLNAEGRVLRTQKLIDDLKSVWQERALCKPLVTAREATPAADG